jgi:hypothetical protein
VKSAKEMNRRKIQMAEKMGEYLSLLLIKQKKEYTQQNKCC